MEMNVDVPGMPMNGAFMIGTMQTTQTVTGVDGDVIEYTIVTDSARFETPGMPQLQGQMPDQTGETQVMSMTTRGKVESMDVPGASSEAQQLMGALGGLSFELPEEAVALGATWTADLSTAIPGLPGGGSMSMGMDLTYTLVEITNSGGSQLATVTFEGPISMAGDAAGLGLEASGTTTGTFVFDLTQGRINTGVTEMNMSLVMAGAGMTMGQSVTTEMRLIG